MKYIYTFLILTLSTCYPVHAFGNSFNGQFVCEIIYVSDGSKEKLAMVIDGDSKKEKRLGFSDTWYSEEKLIHRGEYNSFLTFVRQKNTILEDVTIITKMSDGSFHYNRISTSEDDKYSGIKQAQARHKVGLCEKF